MNEKLEISRVDVEVRTTAGYDVSMFIAMVAELPARMTMMARRQAQPAGSIPRMTMSRDLADRASKERA